MITDQDTVQIKIQQKKQKMRELTIHLEKLDREYQQLLQDVDLSPDQIQTYMDDPANFSKPIWEKLQLEKKKLDEKLNLSLNNVKNTKKIEQTFSERGAIQRHWIFVR